MDDKLAKLIERLQDGRRMDAVLDFDIAQISRDVRVMRKMTGSVDDSMEFAFWALDSRWHITEMANEDDGELFSEWVVTLRRDYHEGHDEWFHADARHNDLPRAILIAALVAYDVEQNVGAAFALQKYNSPPPRKKKPAPITSDPGLDGNGRMTSRTLAGGNEY
jgi:hypothetical protein